MALKVLELEATYTDRMGVGLDQLTAKVDAADAKLRVMGQHAQQAASQWAALEQATGRAGQQIGDAATQANVGSRTLARGLGDVNRELGALPGVAGTATGAVSDMGSALARGAAQGGAAGAAFAGAAEGIRLLFAAAGTALDKTLAGLAAANDKLEQFRKDRVTAAQQLSDLGREVNAASRGRAQAEADATGEVLRSIAQERDNRLQEIKDVRQAQLEHTEFSKLTAREAADFRKKFDTEALEATAAALEQFDAKRKAALSDLATAGRAIFESLGPGFEDVTKKLALDEKLKAAADQLKVVQGLLDATKISGAEAAQAVGAMTDQLKDAGATGQQIGQTLPAGLRAIGEAAASTSARTRAMAADISGAKEAAEALERKLVKESLDDALESTGLAAVGAGKDFRFFGDDVKKTTDRTLGGTRDLLHAAQALNQARGDFPGDGGFGGELSPAGEGGRRFIDTMAAGRTPFAFPTGGLEDQALAAPFRTGAPIGIQNPDLATVLRALANPFSPEFVARLGGGITSSGAGETQKGGQIVVGVGPFGPIFKDAATALQEIKAQMRAQMEDQQRVAAFMERDFGRRGGGAGRRATGVQAGASGGGGEGAEFDDVTGRRRPSGSTRALGATPITVHVNMTGTNVVDSTRRVYELGGTIARAIGDRTRRGLA